MVEIIHNRYNQVTSFQISEMQNANYLALSTQTYS